MTERKAHWEQIYTTKQPHEVSWTQAVPETSLQFIRDAQLGQQAHIIDIGGGDSRLVDYLLDEGYEHITVLDISEQALERAKTRIGERAEKVQWIVSDITEFEPQMKYDFWHDRAAFHFLTTDVQIEQYLKIAMTALKENSYLTIGTFSDNGPKKCSGLEIKQYNEETLNAILTKGFEQVRCITEDHITPFNTIQNFLFCSFVRKAP